jgi:hypothetical protein
MNILGSCVYGWLPMKILSNSDRAIIKQAGYQLRTLRSTLRKWNNLVICGNSQNSSRKFYFLSRLERGHDPVSHARRIYYFSGAASSFKPCE